MPEGWLLCDGAGYSRTGDYEALFAAIGTTWGTGDGSTTFNVPDFRGRALIGSGAGINQNTDGSLAGLTLRNAGPSSVGQKNVTLAVSQIPPHNHTYTDRYGPARHNEAGLIGTANGTTSETERITGAAGSGGPHNNLQPSAYMNFIIKQ